MHNGKRIIFKYEITIIYNILSNAMLRETFVLFFLQGQAIEFAVFFSIYLIKCLFYSHSQQQMNQINIYDMTFLFIFNFIKGKIRIKTK